MALVSIDPGLRGCGVAVFGDVGQLRTAAYVRNSERRARGAVAWYEMAAAICFYLRPLKLSSNSDAVIEEPQVYQGNKSDDADDLIQLAGVDGAIVFALRYAFVFAPVQSIKPREWKGQVPKDVMVERVWQRLSARERKQIAFPSRGSYADGLNHNVLDAVGIGLWKLKRLTDTGKGVPLFRRKS